MTEESQEEPLTYNDILRLVDDKVTESETLEYKKSIKSGADLATEICAMANTSGGRIIIGIEAQDRIPTALVGWVPIKNLDSGITQHLREKTKPSTAIGPLKIYDVSIPDNSPMVVTVCEVARAYEAVWYREGNADLLYLKKGSSSLPAKEREEYVGVILGRNSDAHELADMEMTYDNFDAAEGIFDDILFSNTRDFKAWIGKLECSAYGYDSDKAIDCFKKAVNIDREAARNEVFSILVHLKQIYLEFTTKTYSYVDLKTGEVTKERSDIPFDGKWEIEELKTTIEDVTESYCDEFPSTAESHLLRFTICVIHGKIEDALAEHEKARTIGSKNAEIQTLIKVEELEARWLTKRQSLLSFALASLVLSWTVYFGIYALPGFLDKWGGSWIDKQNVVVLSAIPVITTIMGLFLLAQFLRLRKAAKKHFGILPGRRTKGRD